MDMKMLTDYSQMVPGSMSMFCNRAKSDFSQLKTKKAKNYYISHVIKNWWNLALNGSDCNPSASVAYKWLTKNHIVSIYGLKKVAQKNSKSAQQLTNANAYLQQKYLNNNQRYVHYKNHQIKPVTQKELLNGLKLIKNKTNKLIL